MLARLILALLLAAFALPAMAVVPCHDQQGGMRDMPAGMTMRHDAPAPMPEHDRKAIAVHACVGCIPPVSIAHPVFAAPLRPEGVLRAPSLARFDASLSTPPATPPPRRDA